MQPERFRDDEEEPGSSCAFYFYRPAFRVARDFAFVFEVDGAAVGEAACPDGFEDERKRRFRFWRDDDAFECAATGAAVFSEKLLFCGLLAGDAGAGDYRGLFGLSDRDRGAEQ